MSKRIKIEGGTVKLGDWVRCDEGVGVLVEIRTWKNGGLSTTVLDIEIKNEITSAAAEDCRMPNILGPEHADLIALSRRFNDVQGDIMDHDGVDVAGLAELKAQQAALLAELATVRQ